MHSDPAVKETTPDMNQLFQAYESYAHPHKKWLPNAKIV